MRFIFVIQSYARSSHFYYALIQLILWLGKNYRVMGGGRVKLNLITESGRSVGRNSQSGSDGTSRVNPGETFNYTLWRNRLADGDIDTNVTTRHILQ